LKEIAGAVTCYWFRDVTPSWLISNFCNLAIIVPFICTDPGYFHKHLLMQYEEFIELRDQGLIPDDIHPLLQALLLDAAGDWDSAHRIAQEELTADGSRVHAYLHRVEGDLSNAAYWYSSAGRRMPDQGLDEEWQEIARSLLASES
jgi:hypothetical protein